MPETERFEQLDITERWSADLFQYVQRPGFFVVSDIDMTQSREIVEVARELKVRLTYSHLVVRAVGLALHRMGDLHCLIERSRRFFPRTVDAAVPVGGTGDRFLPTSMLLRDIGRMELLEIRASMDKEAAILRETGEPEKFRALRQAAAVLNRGWIRSTLVRRFLKSAVWRRKYMGTVHISFLKDVDFFTPLTPFVGIGLGAGQVSERATVRDGKICIRPMMTISCCCDHAVWDGLTATRFMAEMKKILVDGELWGELERSAEGQSLLACV
jgi:2-oxoacid dehydrogenases acyltransferase (catalytic domain)